MSDNKQASEVLNALDNELPPPPAKRRRGPGKKKSMLYYWNMCNDLTPFLEEIVVDPDEDGSPEDGDVPQPGPAPTVATAVSISYTLSIFTAAQMKKDKKKRGDPKMVVMQLKCNIEWDTFKAKVLSKIEATLKPESLSFDDYCVSFCIARLHPTPTELANDDTYLFMTGRASRSKDPSVSIIIEPITTDTVSYSFFK